MTFPPCHTYRLLVPVLFALTSPIAQADRASLIESQTDKVSCRTYKEDGQKLVDCQQITTGKYTISASISADTFEWYGIYLADVTEDTPLAIQVGDFSFEDTLRNARSKSLKWNSLSGTWHETHEKCKTNPKTRIETCRDVIDTTVKISASYKGASIKVSGKWSENPSAFGHKVFAATCSEQTSGYKFQHPASISVGGVEIPGLIEVRCRRVNTKSVLAKDGNDYSLNNMTIDANLIPQILE